MSGTEIVVVIGGLVLGYWIMAVFVPSFWDRDPPVDGGPQRADDHPDRDADRSFDAPPDIVRWFEVLEISESSSLEQITTAYKRLIRRYHPDLVAQTGRELRELAEVKSKEINVAYDIALKLRTGSRRV